MTSDMDHYKGTAATMQRIFMKLFDINYLKYFMKRTFSISKHNSCGFFLVRER